MTGDDHANGGTAGRFDGYKAASPPGCSVADWECVRSTSYVYPNTPITDAQAAAYDAQGFEVGAARHARTAATSRPRRSRADFADQLATLQPQLPERSPRRRTNRTHCIAWSDYVDAAAGRARARHPARYELLLLARRRGSTTAPGSSPGRACRCASPTSTAR